LHSDNLLKSRHLHPDDFKSSAPGRLIRSLSGDWTFEPAPLPPSLQYTSELVEALSLAERALGELKGVGRSLPNPHLLIRPYVRREAILSSRIEGTVTRLGQLLIFEAGTEAAEEDSDLAEVLNYIEAVDFGIQQLREGYPLSLSLLRAIHARLMQGVRGSNKKPGAFRPCDVWIGRQGLGPQSARFVPPSFHTVELLMQQLEAFWKNPGRVSPLVELALVHYQFEAIHPFMDGNGRLGRLLMMLLLHVRGRLDQPLLYLSAYLHEHDAAYRDHLLLVSQTGSWEAWIEFIARGITEQANDALERTKRILDLQSEYRRELKKNHQPEKLLDIIDMLFESPAITAKGIVAKLGVSDPTAQKHVKLLVDAEILREVSGKRRDRVYIAPAIFALLGDEAEMAIP
ncbi:MAG: Fic family protein, partial [Gemmataceae bacterium]